MCVSEASKFFFCELSIEKPLQRLVLFTASCQAITPAFMIRMAPKAKEGLIFFLRGNVPIQCVILFFVLTCICHIVVGIYLVLQLYISVGSDKLESSVGIFIHCRNRRKGTIISYLFCL